MPFGSRIAGFIPTELRGLKDLNAHGQEDVLVGFDETSTSSKQSIVTPLVDHMFMTEEGEFIDGLQLSHLSSMPCSV